MSAKPDDLERLRHMIDAIDRIEKFTSGMQFDDFEQNEMAQFAVIKNFEIIGEAAYHVSDAMKLSYPASIVWRTLSDRLQALRAGIDSISAAL